MRAALDTEADFDTPFLVAPVLLGAGAILYFAAPSEPDWSALLLGFAAVTFVAYAARARPAASALCISILLLLAGALAGKLETWRSGTKMLGSAVTTSLSGRVVALERQPGGRTRVVIDIHSTGRPRLKYAPDRVRLVARSLPELVAPGSMLTGRARLMPHSGPIRPQGYDFSYHAYFDGIGAVGFFLGTPRMEAAVSLPWRELPPIWLEQARDRLTERIRKRIEGSAGEIAAALITGAKAGIPEDINEALRRTGLAHILSISGLHMALVAGTVIAVLRVGFALFPQFASNYPVRKYAVLAALCTVTLYLFISGAGIATQRSFLMLGVMLVALMLDRPAITMRNLAIAAMAIVALRPHEVVGPGFQMSFAATAALIAVYGAWSARRMARSERGRTPSVSSRGPVLHGLRKLALYAGALVITSLVAGTATAVFGVWHFHRLAPLGLFANLAAMPVVSLLVMPSAVAGMALMPFDLDGPAFNVMGQGIELVVAIAVWFSARTPIDTVGLIPVASLLAASIGLVLATLPRTRLRLFCIPFFAAAVVSAATRTLPDLFVSEDGKLVAVLSEDGRLAINRKRPRAFTMDIWERAAAANGRQTPARSADPVYDSLKTDAYVERFVCSESLCVARLGNGALIVHASTAAEAVPLCSTAAVIVIEQATGPPYPCSAHRGIPLADDPPVVVTARDLALRGALSATVSRNSGFAFSPGGAAPSYSVEIARSVSTPWRPWHVHRAYSREARGLPPLER